MGNRGVVAGGRCLLCAAMLLFACGGSADKNGSNSAGSGGNESGGSNASGSSGKATGGKGNGTGGTGGTSGGSATGGADCAPSDNCAGRPPTVGAPEAPCEGGCSIAGRPTPGPKPLCPEKEPTLGDDCPKDGLICSYGDTLEASCRSYFRCSGKWQSDEVAADYPCTMPPADFCPAKLPAAGSECVVSAAGKGVACVYSELSCYCTGPFIRPGTTGNWLCFGPPADTRCPAQLPNLGDGCDQPGTECHYSADNCSAHPYSSVFCFEGEWEVGSGYPCVGF
ncbi:MAG TPA: hypothetical protein VG937_06620 [Polyangiaceae bacterium]|nr:hypothetical protein [Polyangiaceae bacterium]